MIPGSANPLLLAPAAGGYQVSRSLRFNSADSAYLSRTPAVAGNRRTWTWAGWVKKSGLGTFQNLFGTADAGFANGTYFLLIDDNTLSVEEYGASSFTWRVRSTQVFRDTSAWGHLLVACDTTQATASNRVRIYWNGTEITSFFTANYPTQNLDTSLNTASLHGIGRAGLYNSHYFNGYLADIHFIDGQALTPSSFTEVSATTGQLIPLAYSGSYGTNGFQLKFADNSAATAAALGADTSGNGNNWTPNNLSVTAGAGNDSLVDTPTSYGTDTGVGGEVRGNYATLNPLDQRSATLTNGNLDVSIAASSSGVNPYASGTFAFTTGKWYFEATYTSSTSNAAFVAVTRAADFYTYIGNTGVGYYGYDGSKVIDGTYTSYGSSFTTNDVIGVALNLDAGTVTFYKNNVSQGAITLPSSASGWKPSLGNGTSGGAQGFTANFGQRAFAYPLSGFKALCDTNLAEGTITTSGTFTGNASADGPFVYLNGVPTAMTINSNAVTFATDADKLSNGFKLRTSSGSYNTAGSNSYSITTTGAKFKYARAQPNP